MPRYFKTLFTLAWQFTHTVSLGVRLHKFSLCICCLSVFYQATHKWVQLQKVETQADPNGSTSTHPHLK